MAITKRTLRQKISYASRDGRRRDEKRLRLALHNAQHENGPARMEECNAKGCSLRRPIPHCNGCGGEGYVSFY